MLSCSYDEQMWHSSGSMALLLLIYISVVFRFCLIFQILIIRQCRLILCSKVRSFFSYQECSPLFSKANANRIYVKYYAGQIVSFLVTLQRPIVNLASSSNKILLFRHKSLPFISFLKYTMKIYF